MVFFSVSTVTTKNKGDVGVRKSRGEDTTHAPHPNHNPTTTATETTNKWRWEGKIHRECTESQKKKGTHRASGNSKAVLILRRALNSPSSFGSFPCVCVCSLMRS